MSYCVNCGVELERSEKRCPLCNTIVINPNEIGKETDKAEMPQKEVEVIDARHIDYRLLATIVSILLIIPIAVSLICDIASNGHLSWSLLVIGASVYAYVALLLPAYFKNKRPYKFIIIDGVSLFLLLWQICAVTHGSWTFTIALPLTVAATIASLILTAIFRSKFIHRLLKPALFFLISGILCICTELILCFANKTAVTFNWSHFVMIPCAVLSIILVILDSQRKLKDELRKKLFM